MKRDHGDLERVLKLTFLVAADIRRLIIQHGFLADQSLLTSAATILKQALKGTATRQVRDLDGSCGTFRMLDNQA